MTRLRFRVLALAGMIAVLGSMVPVATAAGPWPSKPSTSRAILFGSDGMRPDLVDKYVEAGAMPNFEALYDAGVKGVNGMQQAFPPNTGVGWHTVATGTYPGEHGSMNNTFHRIGEASFNNRTGFGDLPSASSPTGVLQADHIAQAAERAGKQVVSVEWVGTRTLSPQIQGPVVDFRSFFSNRGIFLNFDMPAAQAGAAAFGVQYQRQDLDSAIVGAGAGEWENVPTSFSPPKQESIDLGATTANLANDVVDMYIFDATNDATVNYDSVLFVLNSDDKDGSKALAQLNAGEWADVKVRLIDDASGARTAGMQLKVIDLTPNLSQFRVYFTSLARANATYNALGAAGSAAFQETLNSKFPSSTAADFAPLEAGIIDEDTYVEQGLMWADAHFAYLNYIMGAGPVPTVDGGSINGLHVQPQLLLLGNPVTDEFSHQFLALTVPTDIDGNPNPYFDDVQNDDVPDARLAAREG